MKVYRQSIAYLVPKLAVQGFFSLLMIGIPFFIGTVLEYFTAEIRLESKSVLLKRGVLGSKKTEIPYRKINSISINQGLLGKLFNYGDVIVMAGNDSSGIPFKGISSPETVKSDIYSKMD